MHVRVGALESGGGRKVKDEVETDRLGSGARMGSPVDNSYQFEDHLREHRPARLGQRLWWMPAAAGAGVVIADGVYWSATPFDQMSAALAVALPFIAALLFLLAWAALSIAEWTYLREQHYRDAHHAAASQARAYILAGRRASGELPAA